MRPSNSGTATWVATSSGRHTVVVVVPLRPRTGQAQALQDRDIQRGKVCHVPGVVVAACGDGGGRRAARRQHGGHHRVGRAEQLEQVGVRRCAATRSTPAVPARLRLRSRCTALRCSRCCPRAAARGSRAPRSSGRRASCDGAFEDAPGRSGRPAARNRSRSSARCRTGKRAAGAGCPRRPAPDRRAPAARRRRAVECSISSASGDCSPLTTTVGTPLATTASMPSCQAR